MTKDSSRFDTRINELLSACGLCAVASIALTKTRDQIQRQGSPRSESQCSAEPSTSRALASRGPSSPVAVGAVVAVVVMSGSGSIAAGVETAPGAAQAGGTAAIRRIAIATRGSAVVVTIEGSGNLPLPTAGFADEPPRLFFDFPGVTLAAPRVTSGHRSAHPAGPRRGS